MKNKYNMRKVRKPNKETNHGLLCNVFTQMSRLIKDNYYILKLYNQCMKDCNYVIN